MVKQLFFHISFKLAEVGRPMAGLCQLAPAEGLLASLALLLALLMNLVTFLMKELYGWSLEMVTQHQYSYDFTKIKNQKFDYDYLVVFPFNLSRLRLYPF